MFRIRVAMVYSTGFVLMPDLVREETSEISKEGMWDLFLWFLSNYQVVFFSSDSVEPHWFR